MTDERREEIQRLHDRNAKANRLAMKANRKATNRRRHSIQRASRKANR